MSRRLLVIIGLASIALVAGLAAMFLTGRSTPAPLPSLPPSPNAFPSAHPEAFEAHQEEAKSNPLLAKLPYGNRYFYLTFGVSQNDTYVVEAKVSYIQGKERPEDKFRQQEPHIIAYFRSIGQPDGTYVIQYVGNPVQDTAAWR